MHSCTHTAQTRLLRATSTNLDGAKVVFFYLSNVRSTVGEPRGAGRPAGAFVICAQTWPKRKTGLHMAWRQNQNACTVELSVI